jgi:hypothetical protein
VNSTLNGDALPLFDGPFPIHERLPRRMRAALLPDGLTTAQILVAPRQGPLRPLQEGMQDWAHLGDGGRWSIAIHLAFAAHLGWSPVLRSLLGLKRRTSRALEKGEDGVRAQMAAEGACSLIINSLRYSGPLQCESLRQLIDDVRRVVRVYEIAVATNEQWEGAIENGLLAYSQLNSNNGGVIDLDLDARTTTFSALPRITPSPEMADDADSTSFANHSAAQTATRRVDIPSRMRFYLKKTKAEAAELFLELDPEGLLNIGSKAEEWSHSDVGFKWHDVFHLSNLAIHGSSPVTCNLLGITPVPSHGLDPTLGRRERTVEEAIISFLMHEACHNPAMRSGEMPADVFALIGRLAAPFGLSRVSLAEWSSWLTQAFGVWRRLQDCDGGLVEIDTAARTIAFAGPVLQAEPPQRPAG